MTQATIQDLLDLRTAQRPDGKIVHRECGGQIVWSIFEDVIKCTHCRERVSRIDLLDYQKKLGKSGYYQYNPPMDLVANDKEEK